MFLDPKSYVNVHFKNVIWPTPNLPNKFKKLIRCEFLMDNDNKIFNFNDLKDILKAWLYDEFKICPYDLDYCIIP